MRIFKLTFVILYFLTTATTFSQSNSYFLKGMEREKIGDYRLAMKCYSKAINLNPTDTQVLKRRAFLLSKLNKSWSAIKDFDTLIKSNPNEADYYYVRGILFAKLKHYYKAINDFSKAIVIDPLNFGYYSERGICKFKNKDFKGAVEDFSISIINNVNNPGDYFYRGSSLITLGLTEAGCNDIQVATKMGFLVSDSIHNDLIAKCK